MALAYSWSIDCLAFQQKAGDGLRVFGDVPWSDCEINRCYGNRWIDIDFPEALITDDITADEPGELIGVISVFNDPVTKKFLRSYMVTRGILSRAGGKTGFIRISCEVEQISPEDSIPS